MILNLRDKMIYFNKIISCLIVFSLIMVTNTGHAKIVSYEFSGRWCWEFNNNINNFSIDIVKINNKYKGGYDSVSQSGNKIDDNDSAFSFGVTTKKTIKTKLKSGITGNIGLVELELINKNKLKWIIIKHPDGEMYLPSKAILYKCTSK